MREAVSGRNAENGIKDASGGIPGIGRRQGSPIDDKACHQQKFCRADVLTIAHRHTGRSVAIWRHT